MRISVSNVSCWISNTLKILTRTNLGVLLKFVFGSMTSNDCTLNTFSIMTENVTTERLVPWLATTICDTSARS